MKGKINTEIGTIVIDSEVVAKRAGLTAIECFGVVGMAALSMKDGIVKLLKKESLTHGVQVDIQENQLSIHLHIIVVYGVSISAVADTLIHSVQYQVEKFTGLKVKKIHIYVEGVRIVD